MHACTQTDLVVLQFESACNVHPVNLFQLSHHLELSVVFSGAHVRPVLAASHLR